MINSRIRVRVCVYQPRRWYNVRAIWIWIIWRHPRLTHPLLHFAGVASDNCLECRCAAQAMFCSPKCCFFALEERLLREARGGEEQPPRPHPLQAYITL